MFWPMGGLRLGSLEVFAALLLSGLAGCGGRSTFDSDALATDPDQPVAGSTTKPRPKPGDGGSGNASSGGGQSGAPTGGKASVPAGGSPAGGTAGNGAAGDSSTPSSGGASGSPMGGSPGAAGAASGGAGGLDPLVSITCADYCNTSTHGPCPNGFPSSECVRSCVSELALQSLQCQKTGATLLSCLTTVYKNSSSCNEVEQLSRANCSPLFESYHTCTAPVPVPAPQPPLPVTCSSSGSSSNGKCSLDVKCNSGAFYSVACYQTSTEQSSCTCNASFPDGSGSGSSFGLNENATFACYDSLATCGFPQIGAP